ncbi:MAG: SLBB domain-containing protein [candidate division NC10 bacterium]|nr:SLBB domain-containing protein [candidate division NC10 bacterium]MDE2321682.1 SLBB domain-containing protein [candidate division NC10 bacterium]
MRQGYILYIGLGILVAGCASTGPSKETLMAMASASQSSESTGNVAVNSKIISTAATDGFVGDYVIGAGDLLVISVLDLSELEKLKVRVGAEGFINLPLVGLVKVRGLTARRLERELADLVGQKFLYNPQVSVFIEEYRSQRVAVLGEVNKPGIYEVNDRRMLTDMLAQAGGLGKEADRVVYVLRKNGGTGTASSSTGDLLKVDLDELLLGLDPSLNVKVSSGDVISVPKSGEFLLGGAVRKPGPYPLKGKLTVDQAIYFGESLKDEADLSNIEVLRFNGPKIEVFHVDLEQLRREGKPAQAIQKNDVVFVGTSGPKAALYGAVDVFKAVVHFGLYPTMTP